MTWAAMASKTPASSSAGKTPPSSASGRGVKSQQAAVRSPPEVKPDPTPVTSKPKYVVASDSVDFVLAFQCLMLTQRHLVTVTVADSGCFVCLRWQITIWLESPWKVLEDDLLVLDNFNRIMPSVLWRCWLGGRKGIRPVKNWAVGCWRGYLSGARCRLAYGPADATATHYLLLQ